MIIGLGYKARSGKDTAATMLEGFRHIPFAYALKNAARAIFGLTPDQLYRDKETTDPFWNDTPRNMLQKLGTECLRQGYGDNVWIRAVERVIRNEGPKGDWVIPDVRFENEAQAIKEWGGFVVRVDRPQATAIATNQHASETALDDYTKWDYILNNEGTLKDLRANVAQMLRKLREVY